MPDAGAPTGSRHALERPRSVSSDRRDGPNRTVVLAIDGLDADTLERRADALPTLASMADAGTAATLEPPLPGCRASAWASLLTGTDPSHHGVFGPFVADGYPDDVRRVSRVDVRRPTLWDYLSSQAAPSIVCGVPMGHPADSITGVLVPGPDAKPGATRPPAAGRGQPAYPDRADGSRRTATADRRTWTDRLERRARTFRDLLETHDWELALCSFPPLPPPGDGDTDVDGGDGRPGVRETLEAVDRAVASTLEVVGRRTNVIVCSTRGRIGGGSEVSLNAALADCGYLEWAADDGRDAGSRSRSRRERSRRRGRRREWNRRGASGASEATVLDRARRVVGRVGFGAAIDARVGFGAAIDAAVDVCRRGWEELRTTLEWAGGTRTPSRPTVAWDRSLAYCASGAEWGVRVNLAGREPDGRVPPSRYDDVCDELVDVLAALETPTGGRAFASVRRREDRYAGPFLERAPDVCCRPAGGTVIADGLPAVATPAGDRSDASGLLLARGPGFVGDAPDRLSITDVAPTALASLERPVPSLMTGRVPDGFVRESRRAWYDGLPAGVTTHDPTFDDAEVRNRLEWLDSEDGWLE